MKTASTSLSKKDKRFLKKYYKKCSQMEGRAIASLDPRILIERIEGEYDQTKYQYLVKAHKQEEVVDILSEVVPIEPIIGVPSTYDCTGQPFCDSARIKRVGKERYYVTQIVQYDL